MTIIEAIDKRCSRRKYLNTPLNSDIIEKLNNFALEYSQKGKIRLEMIYNNGKAFNGLLKSYGMLSNVKNYAVLIANKDDIAAAERLGYYGELLMLNAVAMGLGTCWVGGSFDRKLCPVKLTGDEQILCTITIGFVPEQLSAKEKFIYNMIHRKTKTIEEMFVSDVPVPDWFMNAMRAVQKAPSAINRQPVLFSFKAGKVSASIKNQNDAGMTLDMGIAKLHFELGAGKGKWNFQSNEYII